jgi:hypothetical protein
MPHPLHPAPADSTVLQPIVHQRLPHRRCSHPAIAPPQSMSAREGGQPAVCICPWQDPPVALTKLTCYIGCYLRAGAPAPRRYGSRPPRWRLYCRSRHMTVAAAPLTPLPPLKASLLARLMRNLQVSYTLGPSRLGRRVHPSNVAGACAQKRAGIASHRIVARSSPHTSLTALPPPSR